jgi:uncharacterized protein (DUF305 family)
VPRPAGEHVMAESSEHTEDAGAARGAGLSRVLVLAAAALALLLVGGAAGIFVGMSGSSDEAGSAPVPSAVDVGFAQDMSTHHLQAVQMTNWERDHTNDPTLQQLAFDLEQTQLEQIGRMKGWLSLWGEPEQGSGADQMSWMTDHARHDGMSGTGSGSTASGGLMPGMATQAELAQLRSRSGGRLDVRFLQLMLRHHQGGIPMAEYAVRHAGDEPVRTLAQSMVTSQDNEIALMRQLLAERGAKPLPAPS